MSGLKHCVVLAFALIVGGVLPACDRAAPIQKRESYVFGTLVNITVYGEEEKRADEAMAAVLQEFDRLHRTCHAWKPSALTALNEALAKGQRVEVSPEMAAMLADAQKLSQNGDGLFDPALGKLIELWGFHDDTFEQKALPPPDKLAAARAANPRMSDLVIDGNYVSSRNPVVKIDLGGYAKGYALDRAVLILKEKGIRNALVNIGGNIIALGQKGDRPWRVGIQHPREPGALAEMPLYDGEAIGTSGDYQRYFELGGKRYSHLLDPRTGAPSEQSQAFTVLAPPGPRAGVMSDVASKPGFIAGNDWQKEMHQLGIDAAMRTGADGHIEVTPRLRARLKFLVPER